MIVSGLVVLYHSFGYNDIQNFQIIQPVKGKPHVQTEGGWYTQFFATIWTYPKIDTIYFSNEKSESKDNDALPVTFAGKGTGSISVQVVARYYTDEQQMLKLHNYAKGSVEWLQSIIEATCKQAAMNAASTMSTNDAIENYNKLNELIRKAIIDDKELKEKGICIDQFSITKIDFDEMTLQQFQAQQQADLERRLAEAQQVKFNAKQKETIAKYEQEKAESQGKAEVVMIKETTDAERQKRLAEIEAEKKVNIETFAKQEALIKAVKEKEMAEITAQKQVQIETLAKQEALIKAAKEKEMAEIAAQKELEVSKLLKLAVDQRAQATIVQAKADKEKLELAKGLSEYDRFNIEMDVKKQIGVAEALSKGIATMQLPKIIMSDGSAAGNNKGVANMPADIMGNLMKVFLIEKTNDVLIKSGKK